MQIVVFPRVDLNPFLLCSLVKYIKDVFQHI